MFFQETDPLMSFSDSSFALLYGKFKSQAMRVKVFTFHI